MTKLFNEVKDLTIDESRKLLVSVNHLDLVREYKELADFTCLQMKEEKPKAERICINCDKIVTGRAKKCDACKAIPVLKEKEVTNANSH